MTDPDDHVIADQHEADGPVAPTPAAPEQHAEGDVAMAEPFPTLRERVGGWWRRRKEGWEEHPGRVLEAAVSVAAVLLGTALVIATLGPSDLLSNSTPTGGDMGSHVWGPRYLIDHLLPNFRLSGWTPDWYSGFPAYQFYMVVPSLMIVALHVGLPWYLAIPVVLGAIALGLAGWAREGLYRYRWLLVAVAGAIVVLSVPISYNRSFKVITVVGLVLLPLAAWFLAKAAKLPFPIPPLVAAAGSLFLFNRQPLFNNTGNIIGGNFQSTMAGEFAFSISVTLALVYLGVAAMGLRTGRYRALAAVTFALAGLCHLIPAFFVLACTVALLVVRPNRARAWWLATMVPVAGLLTAFWVVPFALRSDYVNHMGWEKLPLPNAEESSVWYYLLPDGWRLLFVAAAVGIVVSLIRRYDIGLVLALAWAGVWAAFVLLPDWRLWNARLLPFMYLSVAVLAAIGVGEVLRLVGAAAAGDAKRPLRLVTVSGALVVVFGVFVYTALPINGLFEGVVGTRTVTDASDAAAPVTKTERYVELLGQRVPLLATTDSNPAAGWSGNNYRGLEGKEPEPAGCADDGSQVACTSGGWPEYRHLVQTMAGIGESEEFGCGRAFWEYDGDRIGGYGTPMALMMLPYFTDGCIGSQEGLYFESSTTVPYHFLMQAELSTRPSQPQRDLPYPGFDIDAGVRHLQLLGVRYYLASTPNAVDQAARHPDLTEIAVSGPWHIYEVADADTVVPLTLEPAVLEGIDGSQEGWLPTASAWFRRSGQLDQLLAASGPDEWQRVDAGAVPHDDRLLVKWAREQLGLTGAIDQVPEVEARELPAIEVTDIEMGNDSMSFRVSEPGVPVLVKTSYFPNWQVEGGEGPYRVTPNLMVVIPTETQVTMTYGRTPVDLVAVAMTLLGIVGLVVLARRPPLAIPPERPTRLARWIDRALTIRPTAPPPPDQAALGDGSEPAADEMSVEQAARVLLDAAGRPSGPDDAAALLADRSQLAATHRAAALATHPDRPDGSEVAFDLVERAWAVLVGPSEPTGPAVAAAPEGAAPLDQDG